MGLNAVLYHATFLSLWYWVFAVLCWGVICNYTFGVPNELLMRARRSEEDAALFDRYARRNLAMFAARIQRGGALVGGLAAFTLAVVATLALRTGHEAAMGAIVIFAPLGALWFWGGRRIARLDAAQPAPEELRRAFLFERRLTGLTAGVSITLAYLAATLRHGPGWTEALFRAF